MNGLNSRLETCLDRLDRKPSLNDVYMCIHEAILHVGTCEAALKQIAQTPEGGIARAALRDLKIT